jgi:hypothetical protein
MCTLCIDDILVDKKARLFDPCYHQSEVFWIHESSGFQGLSASRHYVLLSSTSKNVILFVCFTKSENRRVEQVLSKEVGTSGRGEDVGKSVGG